MIQASTAETKLNCLAQYFVTVIKMGREKGEGKHDQNIFYERNFKENDNCCFYATIIKRCFSQLLCPILPSKDVFCSAVFFIITCVEFPFLCVCEHVCVGQRTPSVVAPKKQPALFSK